MNTEFHPALLRGVLLFLFSAFANSSAVVAAPNIDHYASMPGAEDAAISPDGRKIAMVQGAGGDNRMVAFYPLDGSTRTMIGDIRHDREGLAGISPVNLAKYYEAPVLLIHGKDDTVVPVDQSRGMKTALDASGKDVTFVELAGEDHWLSTASTRKAMLETSGAFLTEHLGH